MDSQDHLEASRGAEDEQKAQEQPQMQLEQSDVQLGAVEDHPVDSTKEEAEVVKKDDASPDRMETENTGESVMSEQQAEKQADSEMADAEPSAEDKPNNDDNEQQQQEEQVEEQGPVKDEEPATANAASEVAEKEESQQPQEDEQEQQQEEQEEGPKAEEEKTEKETEPEDMKQEEEEQEQEQGESKEQETKPTRGEDGAGVDDQLMEDADVLDGDADADEDIGPMKRFKKRRVSETPRMPQTHAVILPSYASWFSMDRINAIEQKSLPEFFNKKNKSKTPQTYRRYRDFMINTYRLNPTEYLTVTACRRNLTGDVCAIMRIHGFLEKWGLINYQVEAEARPVAVGPPFTGHWKATLDTPRGLFPFQIYKGTSDPAAIQPPQLSSNNNNNSEEPSNATPQTNGVDKSQKEEPQQQNEGENKEEAQKTFDFSDWSKKETLDLLEAIEKTPGDWSAVASHVGNDRTQQECILRFLSLSAEDKFLENKADLGPLKYNASNIPFAQADNPVMSTVSFLASMVDARVAAAAAGRSVEQMKKIEEERQEQGNEEEGNENESSTATQQAAKVALGSIAARAHVLATDSEREMYSQYTNLVSQQLKKIDLKLTKFNQIERNLEIERRELEREREEVFLSRLALHRKVRTVDNMLEKAIEDVRQGNGERMRTILDEAGRFVRDGTKLGIDKGPNDNLPDGKEDIKPISVDIPQSYKYWSA
ncbi:hypothetical protein TRICI_005163 [Trichomonascus ciferrii]|uniref:Uncharacterized protein n=1 Tax=Trichomonascus ciferrii TaxID=44093 RepID=A0A642UVX9_9ASCO|nr:hypothetical protein TRICI_005163 [Trichomonascus ciferrii]